MQRVRRAPSERANDAVFASLRNAILSNALHPGEQLNVPELAKRLGVSLTPVRNAIQLLAAEGLVEVRPRSGTFVARVSVEEVRETFEIRRALECLAVEKAAARGLSPEELAKLRDLLASLEQPVVTEEDRRRHELDNAEFHRTLIEAGRNSRLAAQYGTLNAHIQIARIHAADTGWQARLAGERAEHQAIVEALAAGDSPAAAAAMRTHIDRACNSMLEALEKREEAGGGGGRAASVQQFT